MHLTNRTPRLQVRLVFRIQRAANGMVTLLITNTVGATLTLQTSSNLTSWTTIATLTPEVTPDTFTDTTTSADTNRFYRAFYP